MAKRKTPPPPPKKQKGSVFPVNEAGVKPNDYSMFSFNKQYATPGLEALTELYGDPGLGFLAGLLGTMGSRVDEFMVPPTVAKPKSAKQIRKEKEKEAARIAAEKSKRAGDKPVATMAKRDMKPLEKEKIQPKYPTIAKENPITEAPAPAPSPRPPLPPVPNTGPRSNMFQMLWESMKKKAKESLEYPQMAQPMVSMKRPDLAIFANGGVPKYQDGTQPRCPQGYTWNGSECIVTPTTNTGATATPVQHICPERHKWDEAQKKCVPFNMGEDIQEGYTRINEFGKNLPGLGLVGQAGLNMAQAPGFKPNMGLGIAGGAMQGFSQGGLLGAVGGGLMGALTTGQALDAYNTQADQFQRARIQNANVSPDLGYYAQFGGQTPGAVPSQTETGELVLFPDNTLPDVKASLRHKQMTDDEVTDMLPENSYVFSDDKDMKFDLKAMKDKVLGYGMSYYDEHSNYPTETMRFGDIMPESGKMTFANAARILRSKVPTMGNKKDIFDIATDADNLETRVPYLMELINLQDAKNASEGRTESTMGPQSEEQMGSTEEMPMMQAWGGMVPKYQRGDSYRYVRPGSSGYVQPTRQDSLDLLANAKALTDYYNRQGYTLEKRKSLPPNDPDPIYSLNWSARTYDTNLPRSYPTVTADGKVVNTYNPPLPLKYYHKPHPSDPNKFYQREGANLILDTRAPFGLYDRRIIPTLESEYRNTKNDDPLKGDLVAIYNYDPLAITPIDILYRQNPALVKERERKYGLSAGDKKFLESKRNETNTARTRQTPAPAPTQQQPTPTKEKEKLYKYWYTDAETGEKIPMTAEDYEKYKNLNKEVRGTVDSSKYDIIPYVKQFGGMGSILPTLMEKTYDKSIGSKFLGDKGKALIPIVTTALGVPAIRYGKKWTIIED